MKRLALCMLALGTVSTQLLLAADWPMFRGPQLDGSAPEETAPTKWSADENVRWKSPLPRPGNGSPIVSNGRVFVTSVEDADGKRRSLYAFSEAEGKQLWAKTVELDKKMPTHQTNPYAGSTPAADGERVVVWHASAGLYCYDFEGNELWSRDLGEFRHTWGYGTSPILYKGRVVLHSGPGEKEFIAAFDFKTGETLWETVEPHEGKSDTNLAGKYRGSWSTPVVANVEGQDQLIVALPTRIVACNPDDGTIVWFCEGVNHNKGDLAYSSPIVVGDVVFYTGGFGGPALGVRLGGTGNVTDTHRLWRNENQPQSIGTGVAVDGNVYRPNAGPGTLQCLDPVSGKTLWQDRAGGSQWASIVMAGGLLYATNQGAQTTIFKPNPEKYEEVAVNRLTGNTNATPAVANGRLYFRTDGHLWCIGE